MAKGDIVHGAHTDDTNQVFSMIGVIGTLGTADVTGTALTLPVGVNPDNGAMYVDVIDTQFNVGTLTVGTINKVGTVSEITNGSIVVTAGTVTTSMGDLSGGTIDEITNGSIVVTAGTVTVGNIGTLGTIQSGTVSVNTPGTITSGSISVIAGTVGTVGTVAGMNVLTTVSNVTNGSIVVTAGTVTAGTINASTINSGTINASTINSATINAGTVDLLKAGTLTMLQGGTFNTGTVVNSGGTINAGTFTMSIGTLNSGTLNAATINAGTINAGTIGTVSGVGVVSALTIGSIRVTVGTINASTVNAATITVGSIGGRGANAAATVGFPILTAGMDSGGTAYTLLVDTSRRLQNVVQVGTINSGTINAGTINAGTFTLNALTYPLATGNNYSGTITAGGTWNGTAETIANQQAAQIEVFADQAYTLNIYQYIDAGTTQLVSTDTYTRGSGVPFNENITLPGNYFRLSVVNNSASNGNFVINTTFGVMNTQSRGPDNLGNFKVGLMAVNGTALNLGTNTVANSLPTVVNNGTIVATAGTIKNDGRPARNLLSFATTQVFAGSAFATLVGSASVGAGTSIWVNDLSIVNHNGTVQAGMMFGSAINGTAVLAKGQFGPQGGIQKSFPMPVNCGMTNFDLNCWSDAAGTVTFNVSYFISA
jgi:hypothetical protein